MYNEIVYKEGITNILKDKKMGKQLYEWQQEELENMTASEVMGPEEISLEELAKDLVERHVLWNQTFVVEALRDQDNIEIINMINTNFYRNLKTGEDISVAQHIELSQEEEKLYYYMDSEVLEWWLIDEWLANKLKAKRECIAKAHGSFWWGRTASGQMIYMDTVIEEIAKECF